MLKVIHKSVASAVRNLLKGFTPAKQSPRGVFLREAYRHHDKRANDLRGCYVTKTAMGETSGISGGYLVPVEFSEQLLVSVAEHGFIEPRANVVPMTSRTTLCPAVDSELAGVTNQSPFFGGVNFGWQHLAQGSNVVDATPSAPFKQVQLTAWDLIGEVLLTNQFLNDVTEEGQDRLFEIFAEAAGWSKEWAFLRGTGDANYQPLGIVNAPCKVAASARASGNHIVQADVAKMAKGLIPYSWNHSIWACSPSALEEVVKVTGFVPNEDPLGTEAGCAGSIYTRPLFVTEKLPAIGTEGDIVLFDPSLYAVGNRMECEITMSEAPAFVSNQTWVKVWLRCDGRPMLAAPATLANGGTASMVVTLAA